ncbi:hypothetical protein CEXT_49411 [Caerostris extrusa]|uniref:Uncharacterized protein n=1 Tax=Caerostris extrusa TaxID=172846 RepID=A0AAV4XQA1_CAEEX|nr:hypothetical protein CEXT_49411 [Caerostris extrusa]
MRLINRIILRIRIHHVSSRSMESNRVWRRFVSQHLKSLLSIHSYRCQHDISPRILNAQVGKRFKFKTFNPLRRVYYTFCRVVSCNPTTVTEPAFWSVEEC